MDRVAISEKIVQTLPSLATYHLRKHEKKVMSTD